jgi:hypothetical protein
VLALVVDGYVTGTARERLVLREHRFRVRRHRRSKSRGLGRARRRRLCRRCRLLHSHSLLLAPARPADDQSHCRARLALRCSLL